MDGRGLSAAETATILRGEYKHLLFPTEIRSLGFYS